ncbi:hypothetical protein KALB_7995 [Kutzneria albida DSM 43870]|uniref:Flavodoxin n=1 Tax=Kutzneria albida DSM 43870 TaxID=1449976 RepID=W5WKF9_9PSEU|nr:hypothetical protein KALB_7995 [Kutzneria albida DSM 43870]
MRLAQHRPQMMAHRITYRRRILTQKLDTGSGALKHFFDTVYYPCLDATRGKPYGLYVHGDNDTSGAVKSVEMITTGLGWTRAASPVSVLGALDKAAREACWELGATLAAGLMA